MGAFGLLLRTRDGGTHWEAMPDIADNPKNMHLYAVRGIGDDLYITGEQGVLLKLDRRAGTSAPSSCPTRARCSAWPARAAWCSPTGCAATLQRSTDGGATTGNANLGLPAA